ncbi:DUF2911 domain-containing protein [Maribacter sp. 2304DJ31-5]|uniref:DUF2911 domain-containing protein n=1 Tax=Maribacter sp. 2304DJ31-5 TaxID=3386273 RepID=UPI0039BD68E4
MKNLLPLCLFVLVTSGLFAQYENAVTVPRVSQQAEVKQTIGITDVHVSYSRPLTKGRTIFGKTVSYDNVWRAGADENTVVTFSTDVTINKQLIKAGSYGLHFIPTENDWTVILNTEIDAWGSYFYEESKDIIRFTVSPKQINHHEALTFSFVNITEEGVDLQLAWAETSVAFTIGVNTPELMVNNIRKELKSRLAFGSNGYYTAAQYCLNNDVNLEEALTWADRISQRNKTFKNLMLKKGLLEKLGKSSEAKTTQEKALKIASSRELSSYAFSLLRKKETSNQAIELLKTLTKKEPKNYEYYNFLGHAYERLNNKKEALKAFQKALNLAPKDQKEYIQESIDKFKK